ncbi:type II toxin-antitoxin system HicB family antitoxin [Carboxydothermus pertinax]|uniref:HicB-like antitoxin of toxin-antitoxin system domain-containing protein n=1 Tax=Carboxydothermus pertinax TaxID=870242 RepID=A0A1L8CWP7_9THEO|nr:type II toxin-antitoxin system HicB family antitoxin [Carboxydothermus pertinax]GAV23294.1 hypothetical protein cpu_18040 [Carboxydothermus pertinax]
MDFDKTLEFFMNQDYPIVLRKLSPEDGGGWLAEIPDLPGCMSDGETPEEALANVNDAKLSWLEVAIKRGQKIPLPEKDSDEYSGKFTLRMPKSLHKQLVRYAKKEGVSLNQFILSLLSFNFGKLTERSKTKRDISGYYYYRKEDYLPKNSYVKYDELWPARNRNVFSSLENIEFSGNMTVSEKMEESYE